MLEINDQNCRKICKVHQHYANLLESKHQNTEKGADLNNRRREIGHQSWTGHVEGLKLSETMHFLGALNFAAKSSGEECTSLFVLHQYFVCTAQQLNQTLRGCQWSPT